MSDRYSAVLVIESTVAFTFGDGEPPRFMASCFDDQPVGDGIKFAGLWLLDRSAA